MQRRSRNRRHQGSQASGLEVDSQVSLVGLWFGSYASIPYMDPLLTTYFYDLIAGL